MDTSNKDTRSYVGLRSSSPELREAIVAVSRSREWTLTQTVAEAMLRAFALGPGAAGFPSHPLDGRSPWAKGEDG